MEFTKVIWQNHKGERREHKLAQCTNHYARAWWTRCIFDCQGVSDMSLDERRASKFQFIGVENARNS